MKSMILKSAGSLDYTWLSKQFVSFFQDDPWCEYKMCSNCKSDDDFGPSFAWGIEGCPAVCPNCREGLTLYWSPDRVRIYLTSHDYIGKVVVDDDDSIVAWVWGYGIGERVFYVDTVAILPKYRHLILQLLTSFNEFITDVSKINGFTRIRTRTHKCATNIRVLLRRLGFCETVSSIEDPNRSFWELNLVEELYSPRN